MVRIRPFRSLLPSPGRASQVASPPYDVVTDAEARAIARDNPMSFIRVVRSEVDLPAGTDPYDDRVYARARENLQRMLADKILRRGDGPNLYIYRQVAGAHTQIGVAACCSVDDYTTGVIKRHEKTRQDKEDDRTRHILETRGDAEPVLLTYRPNAAIDELVHDEINERPVFHFVADDGVTHTIWLVRHAVPFVEAFAAVPSAYIADGHHRSASAARAAEAMRGKGGPDAPWNWFLAVLFPSNQLRILPYNRVVRDLGGMSPRDVLQRLSAVGEVRATHDPVPGRNGVVCVRLDGGWWRLAFPADAIDHEDPIRSLDVALLQDRVLEPIFGITDPRTDKRLDFLGGSRGTGAIEAAADATGAAGFSLHPTDLAQLMRVSDADQIMPPKSTWFDPKLRSGLMVSVWD